MSQPANSTNWAKLPQTRLADLDIVTASRAELTAALISDSKQFRKAPNSTRPRLIFDANGHMMSLYQTDPKYQAALDAADVIHADGGFLVTASKLMTKKPITERSATTDLFHDFAQGAQEHGLTVYLLGSTEEVNALCASMMKDLYPEINIVGRQHGYFSTAEEQGVIDEINQTTPDLLWVGLGKPREQLFSVKNVDRLNAAWIVTCGGCFNYVTGHYPRAPMWMQNANLEWLHRMFTNPTAMFWRYLTTTPHALWIVLTQTKRDISK